VCTKNLDEQRHRELSPMELEYSYDVKAVLVCEAVFPECKGGLERWLGNLAECLASMGFDVIYLNAVGVNEFRGNVQYMSLFSSDQKYFQQGERGILKALLFAFRVINFIRKQSEITFVYVTQVQYFAGIGLNYFQPRRGYKLIIEWMEFWRLKFWTESFGSIKGLTGYLLSRILLHCGDLRVTFTDTVKKAMEKHLSVKECVYKLPGIADTRAKASHPNMKDRKNMVFLGRLIKDKDPMLAIDLATRYRDMGWSGTLTIIGNGILHNSINTFIQSQKLDDFIRVSSDFSDREVENCLKEAFVLVHPSKREGYGLAIVEAALQLTPALIISTPENASVDLPVRPLFICERRDFQELLHHLDEIYRTQRKIRSQLLEWVESDAINYNYTESCRALVNLIK